MENTTGLPELPVCHGVKFKYVRGFPGYCVGDEGSAWSRFARVYTKGVSGQRSVLGSKWKPIRPLNLPDGRRKFFLRNNGKQYAFFACRMVLEAFVGECPKGMECCHNNGIGNDDRLSNLRWDTRSANVRDRVIHGAGNQGSRHNMAKLTEGDVLEARRLRASGLLFRDIAARFGVHAVTIREAVVGSHWRHI